MFYFLLHFIFVFFLLFSDNLHADDKKKIITYEVGKPYKIKKKWYYPKNDLNYNEIGIASVNTKKNDTKTKNGEIFSNTRVLAKHNTLALPTIVRVTNLKNGYAINVRINDRGPKNNFRIIELSKKTANYLKIENKALVNVKVISDLSIQEQNNIKRNEVSKYTNDNLEKNVALGKEKVESENLLTNKNKKKEEIKEFIQIDATNKKKLKLNFRKITIEPYYLRINITKFRKFKDASELKIKMKPIYDKILISLGLFDGQKYYKVTTVPVRNLNEAEYILKVIHKKGFNNAKLFIENKKK